MGGIFLEDVSHNESKQGEVQSCTSLFSKTYDDLFPKYLYYGMSEEQYWDGESELPIAFSKANEIRMQHENKKMWYQGLYIYDAISRLLPGFGLNGGKIEDYRNDMFPYTDGDMMKEALKQKKEYKQNQAKSFLEGWMTKVNAERKKNG